ncbi:MAG: carbohydrate ABC transporter permease, partial [Firmicutes bacterium]|nr:carbohydrate ABC transporter permease [Bacillota bacterium]
LYTVLFACSVVVLFPLYWAITTALKDVPEALRYPPVWWPTKLHWENFPKALAEMSFWRCLKNTVWITFWCGLGQLFSSSLAAYAFARFRFPGRDVLFLMALGTIMIPFHVLIIPRFVMFKKLGLTDTFWPLILPQLFAGPLNVFLLRQFFMTIPLELDDAARIDGCGPWGIFWRILLPLSKPVFGIVAVFTFMREWRDFMGPLIYLSSEKNYTLALGLNAFQHQYFIEWNYLMAASVVVMIPPVLVFFLAQRYFIQGIVFSGIKG